MYGSISGALTKKEIVTGKTVTALIGIFGFVLFTALGAYVYIPLRITPVPITLQTFFVLSSGAILGRRLGSLSQVLYFALGATGLPLFLSGSWGISHIFGPTGGYLLGFVAASYIIGGILNRRDSTTAIVIALIIGELVILIFGAAWLWAGLHFSLKQAFYLGVLPFIPGDTLKLIAAVIICKRYLKRAKALFYK